MGSQQENSRGTFISQSGNANLLFVQYFLKPIRRGNKFALAGVLLPLPEKPPIEKVWILTDLCDFKIIF